MTSPAKKWEELKKKLQTEIEAHVREITEIDYSVPWQETEPDWWLSMGSIQTRLLDLADSLNK